MWCCSCNKFGGVTHDTEGSRWWWLCNEYECIVCSRTNNSIWKSNHFASHHADLQQRHNTQTANILLDSIQHFVTQYAHSEINNLQSFTIKSRKTIIQFYRCIQKWTYGVGLHLGESPRVLPKLSDLSDLRDSICTVIIYNVNAFTCAYNWLYVCTLLLDLRYCVFVFAVMIIIILSCSTPLQHNEYIITLHDTAHNTSDNSTITATTTLHTNTILYNAKQYSTGSQSTPHPICQHTNTHMIDNNPNSMQRVQCNLVGDMW